MSGLFKPKGPKDTSPKGAAAYRAREAEMKASSRKKYTARDKRLGIKEDAENR